MYETYGYLQNYGAPMQMAQPMQTPMPQPIQQYQQRLQALEQRYPQFSQQPQQNVQQQIPQIPCRYTSGIEESRAAQISFDGTPNVFIDKASDSIYIKQINLDGNADFLIFKRATDSDSGKTPEPIPETISKEDFSLFATTSAQQLADIKNYIKNLADKVKTIIE